VRPAFAQDNRLLFHYSRYKDVVYNIGDVITFRVKGSKEKHTWQITEITDSTIVYVDKTIAPHRISHLYIDKKLKILFPFRDKYAPYLLIGGLGYFLIDGVNSKEIDRSNLIVSGSMLGAAVLSKILIKDYIKLKHPRKLVILR